MVTTRYAGTATITATCGEFSAACLVNVKDFLETIQFTKGLLYDMDTTYYKNADGTLYVDTIEASSGETFIAYLAQAEVWLFSEGFFVNNEGRFDGAAQAAVVQFYAPMWYATAYLNHTTRGTVFSLGEWAISDEFEGAHVGAPGQLTDEALYTTLIERVLNDLYVTQEGQYPTYLQQAGELFTGATLSEWHYSVGSDGKGGYSYSYIPEGIITEGTAGLNIDDTYDYMYALDWCMLTADMLDNTNCWWGVEVLAQDESTGEITMADNVTWGKTINYSFGELPAEAPKFKPVPARILTIDNPEVALRLKQQLKDNKTFMRK